MSLAAYKKKRSFSKTPEPSGKLRPSAGALRFVVQKHSASHLHYDFRLEMKGVLKSWAVPKGPSMNPADKRLAMMVEDHPYDYRDFEGIIPKGNYGAGTVMVWDEGEYEPADHSSRNKADQEKFLLAGLHKGQISIVLKGEKLKGEFTLVHSSNSEQENAWLLIKKKDRYSSESDITKKDKSVLSGLTLEKIAASSTREWKSNRPSSEKNAGRNTKTRPVSEKKGAIQQQRATENTINDFIKRGKKQAFPANIKPMLATLVDDAFNDDEWLFEVKWDGYRALAFLRKGKAELRSRNNLSFSEKYYPITKTVAALPFEAVLDGEIIAVNNEGNADFQLLQSWQKTGKGDLIYYVFDILWINGYGLTGLPLIERKTLLESIIPKEGNVRYSDHVESKGLDFFRVASQKGLEGIIAKKTGSPYEPGKRTANWLKIKTQRRQEVVVAGFTEGRGGRKYFGALVLGLYNSKNEFIYIGHTGSGFDEKTLKEVFGKLQPLVTKTCPFATKPKTKMPVIWVKPKLVCEVKFQEWTRDSAMRQPIFLGLRVDKKATDVRKEVAADTDKMMEAVEAGKKTSKTNSAKKGTSPAVAKKKENASLLVGTANKDVELTIEGHPLIFTNPAKVYWKKENISKADLLNYYDSVSPFILPYMLDRPQSLNRHPDGIEGKSFYQKNVSGKVAGWIRTYRYISESEKEAKQFLVCDGKASLLYMANLGCIEMNPWHSRVASPDYPDWCVIDLDPGEINFQKVIESANVVRQVLDALDIPSYCKTSGSSGLHIYIPMGAKYTYDQSRQLAELVVNFVHDQIPQFTSLERNPDKRKTKIYLDYLQNRAIQTIAAPYSVRPRPGATVSAPLHWEEVKKGLKKSDFTIFSIMDRLKNEGDPFRPVLKKGIDMQAVLKKAAGFMKESRHG